MAVENTPKPSQLKPKTVVGRYTIVRRIASGGFGFVYLALDNKNKTRCALKEYLPANIVTRDEGEVIPVIQQDKLNLYKLGLKSFFEEGRALAQIQHPSVVGVQNFFAANDTVYMAMDYLEGDSLQDFILTARSLNNRKVFRESTIRSLFDDILQGLRVVHQHKMLHLDIKPANIFITDTDEAILIDFGAAREVLGQQDKKSRPMYTPGFAAPEMYKRDMTFGPFTDIYAIGACLYACMTGYPPQESTHRVDNDKLVHNLLKLRGIYSDNLLEIVEWCMALDAMARPQSVFNLQKELNAEGPKRYTKLTLSEKIKLQMDELVKKT